MKLKVQSMKKTDKNTKIVTGAIIGGVIGVCTLTIILSLRKHKNTGLNNLESAISHLNELFEKNKIEEPDLMKNLGKNLKLHESTLLEIAEWLITGINLWKKFHE